MLKTGFIFISIFISTISFCQTTVFTEDFQNGIPNNWTIINNDGLTPYFSNYDNAWISIVDPNNPDETVASSTSYFTPSGIASRWLITPSTSLGSFGNSVKWHAKSQDASFPDSYVVLVSTTDTQLSSFTDTIANIQEENFEWIERTANLSDYGLNNQPVYIAFVNNTNDGYKLYIDSISVEIDNAASINIVSKQNISIFPNPTSKTITINGFDSKIEMNTIYDNIGNIILKNANSTIDVSNLIDGIYIIEVKTSNSIVKRKFIKN